jgi:hypothetical protein
MSTKGMLRWSRGSTAMYYLTTQAMRWIHIHCNGSARNARCITVMLQRAYA